MILTFLAKTRKKKKLQVTRNRENADGCIVIEKIFLPTHVINIVMKVIF